MKQITVSRAVRIRLGDAPDPIEVPAGDQMVDDAVADRLVAKGLATPKRGRPKRETTAVTSEEIEVPERSTATATETKRPSRSKSKAKTRSRS